MWHSSAFRANVRYNYSVSEVKDAWCFEWTCTSSTDLCQRVKHSSNAVLTISKWISREIWKKKGGGGGTGVWVKIPDRSSQDVTRMQREFLSPDTVIEYVYPNIAWTRQYSAEGQDFIVLSPEAAAVSARHLCQRIYRFTGQVLDTITYWKKSFKLKVQSSFLSVQRLRYFYLFTYFLSFRFKLRLGFIISVVQGMRSFWYQRFEHCHILGSRVVITRAGSADRK